MNLRKYILYISILLSLPAGYLQAASDGDPRDPDYVEKRPDKRRPSWEAGRRERVIEGFRSPGGRVPCSICGKVIPDGPGELHIDHYKEDWVRRKKSIEASREYKAASPEKRKRMLRKAYNASPLRTAHRYCNCARTGLTPGYIQDEQVRRAKRAARRAPASPAAAAAAAAAAPAAAAAAAAAQAATAVLKDETRRRLGFGVP